jgi:uncharacterized protein (DUF1501 family)
MPFTRREFLHNGLIAISTAASIPTFLQHSAQALAQQNDPRVKNTPGVPDERILVVVQLSGGNDGLNTVVPFGEQAYYDARPRLAIAQREVLRPQGWSGIGLHPELKALQQLLDDNHAAVVQGVGYPNPNRSHFASMDIWHTCDTQGAQGLGWIGKAMDQVQAAKGQLDATTVIAMGAESPLATHGKQVQAVTFENASLFRWVGTDLHGALAQPYDNINRAGVVDKSADPQAAFVMRTAMDAQIASDRIRAAAKQQPQTTFPGNRLGEQLRTVASMIRAGLPTRVYYVGMGGFDTHANQPYTHGRILREFADSVRAFQQEMIAQGNQGRVLTMAFSEFGRRVGQNASNGTDHGTAGPLFLIGPMVRAGLLGEHPSLTNLDDGDLIHNVDFRCVYAAVLDKWMKVDSTKVIGKSFRAANVLA